MKKTIGIYIGTIVVSIGLILFSFVPYGWKIWENILVSIGCSGIAAAIMAIFLDIENVKNEKKKRNALRKVFLYGVYHELQHLFERLLWFDNVINKIELTKDIKYYLSLDFSREAHSLGYYKVTSLEECEKEIGQVISKYELDNLKQLDDDTNKKIDKMFLIISSASMNVLNELDVIKRNHMFLVANDIFTIVELENLYHNIEPHIKYMKTPKSNYGSALSFIFHEYKNIHQMGAYDEQMFVCWQECKNLIELVIERKEIEQASQQVENAHSVEKNIKKISEKNLRRKVDRKYFIKKYLERANEWIGKKLERNENNNGRNRSI